MDLNDIYESTSQWLKAADLKGTKPIVQIATATVEENTYNGETKKQIVLTFTGKDKKLGLNFTNANRIGQLFETTDITKWPGRSIRLYTDTTKMNTGQTVPCIRVFPDLPEQDAFAAPEQQFSGTPPPAQAVTEDDIPF